jgi:hypothetical protein
MDPQQLSAYRRRCNACAISIRDMGSLPFGAITAIRLTFFRVSRTRGHLPSTIVRAIGRQLFATK